MDLPGYHPQQPQPHDSRPESEENCPVCGDRVSGYHYGLLTCESCKGFFKRSVQNNKHYTCADQQSCPVNLSQRKRCPSCRFQKCLAVGMKREAVRADRMRGGRNKFGPLYRRDRQMKQRRMYNQEQTAPNRIKTEPAQTHCPHAPRRGLTPPSLPYPALYHCTLPGYPQEKGGIHSSCSSAPANYAGHSTQNHPFTPRSTPASSPCSTPSSSTAFSQAFSQVPAASPLATVTPSFLGQLLEGEQDESQLCAKVLASLQREQANRGKHDRLNTFSIMCKMADQTLFGLVEWARNSSLFKELKIEVSTILSQAGATLSSLVSRTQDLVSKFKALQLDRHEFVCLKYLVLFNPDVKSVQSRRQVEQTQEKVNRALMEHTQQCHSGQSDKFGQLLLRLPEVRSISLQVEEYLYQRHLLGDLPCNSLLSEMLHTKHN
uniref:Nuclear receptor subfamily 5 group A member 2-like n=1 Tax=Salarias fasciatus TaxID=181472 RepID=A0A672HGH6_SALFA